MIFQFFAQCSHNLSVLVQVFLGRRTNGFQNPYARAIDLSVSMDLARINTPQIPSLTTGLQFQSISSKVSCDVFLSVQFGFSFIQVKNNEEVIAKEKHKPRLIGCKLKPNLPIYIGKSKLRKPDLLDYNSI